MIFVILGSQKFQFDRLLKKIDLLIDMGIINDEVMAQIGSSNYTPTNYKYERFIDKDKFNSYIQNSNLIITHGGTGGIITSVKMRKKVIAVPRLAKYDEAVDNHQKEIIQKFSDKKLIYGINEVEELDDAVVKIQKMEFNRYNSSTHIIINEIENFIKDNL